jgi:hypothetical protein
VTINAVLARAAPVIAQAIMAIPPATTNLSRTAISLPPPGSVKRKG